MSVAVQPWTMCRASLPTSAGTLSCSLRQQSPSSYFDRQTLPVAISAIQRVDPEKGSYPGMLKHRRIQLELPGDWPRSSVEVNGFAGAMVALRQAYDDTNSVRPIDDLVAAMQTGH